MKKTNNFLMGFMPYFIGVIIIIAIGLGIWNFKKKMNYNFIYKKYVQQTIKEMVKTECLK